MRRITNPSKPFYCISGHYSGISSNTVNDSNNKDEGRVKKAELSSVSRPEILDSIKDDKSLRLLNWIAKGELSDTERSFDST